MKKSVRVEFQDSSRSYEVVIERGGLARLGTMLKPFLGSSRVFVITDSFCQRTYGEELKASLRDAQVDAQLIGVDLKEKKKSLAMVESIYALLMGHSVERSTALLALGGGVVTDLVGFVAATLLRGLPLIQVPTTLLGQVDAAIGGKTGVNFQDTKNWVGSIYQPKLVFIDPDLLKTLPARQVQNGLMEVIKYGVIADPDLFSLLEKSRNRFGIENQEFYDEILFRSITCKAQFVSEDEKETGKRSLLNFGHTLGHALELECENLLHGEAVGLGMAFAARLSQIKGLCSEKNCQRVFEILGDFSVPIKYNKLDFDSVWQRMFRDKKRLGEDLRMVLMKQIGIVEMKSVTKAEVKNLFFKPELWWRKST